MATSMMARATTSVLEGATMAATTTPPVLAAVARAVTSVLEVTVVVVVLVAGDSDGAPLPLLLQLREAVATTSA